MQNTQITVVGGNGKTVVEIAGSIDENFNLYTKEIPKDGAVNFSLKSLKTINSTGIREWIKLMQAMPKAEISFWNCPKIFIDQVNMVSGFLPKNSKVSSFFVPYYSEDIDAESLVLYKEGEHYSGKNVTVQETFTDSSGKIYELDIVKAKYFKFIQG